MRKYILPVLAIIGVVFAANFVAKQRKDVPKPPAEMSEPAPAPFDQTISGTGIIEASSENIEIASPIGAIVKYVKVQVGQMVKTGDILFTLDDREATANVDIKRAALDVAEAERLDAQQKFDRWKKLSDMQSVSKEEFKSRQYAAQLASANVKRAQAELAAAQTDLEIRSIRAPIDGEVLKVDVRPGEFAPAQVANNPLIILGSTDLLYIRVDIDENDAWRVKPNTKAHASLRGNKQIQTDLKFVRIEPYVVPKKSLTGQSTERVDTRVLQILYSFPKGAMQAYVGQLVDVHIDAGK
ncbi:MAG: efflux RND transporter periplasmic adaptor subunit [Alphaproteobacteria bacterium]|nr:MAG: efflux RND transporter periplasmic adaptor subunit [Alphaproteobacteria bacterium]